MDRGDLTAWSLELSDEEFPLALAALGALCSLPPTILGALHPSTNWQLKRIPFALQAVAKEADGVLSWTAPGVPFDTTLPVIGDTNQYEAPPASMLLQAFRKFLCEFDRKRSHPWRLRLSIRTYERPVARFLTFALTLARAGATFSTVFLSDTFPSDGRTDWNWPFTIALLPGDPVLHLLSGKQRTHANWPITYATASCDMPNVEVLLISASVSEALMRLIASGLRLRCCLVLVVGLGDDTTESAAPLINALVARLSAEGAAILPAGNSAEDFAIRINSFAYELTHNKPLDVALSEPFGNESLLLLNRDLLAVSQLDTTLEIATQHLRTLPDTAVVELSEKSSKLLLLQRGAMFARAPADIADAIDRVRSHYNYMSEVHEASAVTELASTVEQQHREIRRQENVSRYLRQESFRKVDGRLTEIKDGYVVGESVMVSIVIGPKRETAVTSPSIFPEHKLPHQRARHQLQVVFHDPRQFDEPMLRKITLPGTGDSDAAMFVFKPRIAGAFEARVSVLHRGRVLQTLLMCSQIVAAGRARLADETGIWFKEEIKVRQDWSNLRQRRRFDMALVFNHTTSGQPRVTGVAGSRAWAKNLQGIETPVRRINELLSKVAVSVLDYDQGLDKGDNPKLLVGLARVGRDLYSALYLDQLKELATDDYDVGNDKVKSLQIISARQDAVVPVEFFYDFNAPRSNATVCPEHKEALKKDGCCPSDCSRTRDPSGFVCPLGFWGVKKVIERHMYNPKVELPAGAEIVIQAEATEGRNRLDVRLGLVVGHSQEVKDAELLKLLDTVGGAFGQQITVAKDWDEWFGAVKDKHPTTLLAFPHNEGKEENLVLEIGGKRFSTVELTKELLNPWGGVGPLVFLLGCDVAGTAQDFSSHIRYFRQAGAAIIVSTIATVFGPHAVRVGQAIVKGLVSVDRPADTTLGEVMRDAKRAALVESVPMALCVVAFGDADWLL